MARYRTNLEQLRKQRLLTKMDVVRKAGLSYPTVIQWERGTVSSLDANKVQAVLDLLNCTYEELIVLEPNNS